jgi:hypothetical protein
MKKRKAPRKRIFRLVYVNVKEDKGNINRIIVNNRPTKENVFFEPKAV